MLLSAKESLGVEEVLCPGNMPVTFPYSHPEAVASGNFPHLAGEGREAQRWESGGPRPHRTSGLLIPRVEP